MSNTEIITADWQSARNLWIAAKAHARASVASQIMLGWELSQIKKDLGFTHGGRHGKASSHDGSLKLTWANHLKSELGISKSTAHRFIEMAEGAKQKIKSLKPAATLNLIDTPLSDYSDEQHSTLKELVNESTNGETQASFLREIRAAKKPQGGAAKGGNLEGEKSRPESDPVIIALNLWEEPIVELNRAFTSAASHLAVLPLRGSTEEEEIGEGKCLTLDALTEELETRAAEARAALNSRRA